MPGDDGWIHLRIPAARGVRVVQESLAQKRGRRECRVRGRTRSLACEIKKHTSVVTTGTPPSAGIPCAMVLTVSFELSPVTGLCCHRRLADAYPRSLTPASGRQDHTTSPSAPAPLVLRHHRVHRIPPHVRDDAYAPLKRRDGASRKFDLPDGESEIFLQRGLDSDFANAARRANQSGESIPTSSLRKQGPIRRIVCFEKRCRRLSGSH
jgi:hypothetical protein